MARTRDSKSLNVGSNPTEGAISRESLKRLAQVNAALVEGDLRRDELRLLRDRLRSILSAAEEAVAIEYTSWYVFLRCVDGQWESLAVVDMRTCLEDDLPENWDLVLPIPNPATVREFEGF